MWLSAELEVLGMSAEKKFALELQRNPVYPFAIVGPQIYKMSVRYLKLYVAVVALVVSASLAVVWITSGAVYSNYLFLFPVFGVIVSLAAIYNYRSRRVYLLDMMTGEYKFSHDDTVYTRGELHNVYIRLKREARGGGVSQTRKYYHLVYNGFQMDSRKISGSSRNIEELRRLGQQLAETLNINYFDESNSSEHHVVRHFRKQRPSKPTIS